MNRPALKFGTRSLALFLSLCLGLPESALALRNQQQEDPSQLSGLEEALKDPANNTSGLEENEQGTSTGPTRKTFLLRALAGILGLGLLSLPGDDARRPVFPRDPVVFPKNEPDEFRELFEEKAPVAVHQALPERLILSPRKEEPVYSDLRDFQAVSESESRMETVFFQAGYTARSAQWIAKLAKQLRPEVPLVVFAESRQRAEQTFQALLAHRVAGMPERVRFILLEDPRFVGDSGVRQVKDGRLQPGLDKGGRKMYYGLAPYARDEFMPLWNPKTGRYTFLPGESLSIPNFLVGNYLMGFDMENLLVVPSQYPGKPLITGGDFIPGRDHLYMGARPFRGRPIDDKDELTKEWLLQRFRQLSGKEVVVLGEGFEPQKGEFFIPEGHNDRYHAPAGKTQYGNHTSFLGDPLMTLEVLAAWRST